MNNNRVVITGLGILSPNGVGKDAFFRSVMDGISGIKPVSLFDTAPFTVKNAGEISDFDASLFLGPKGLRTLDRSTRLACCAAKLALDDSSLAIDESNSRDCGVVIGSTLGSVKSIVDFHKDSVVDGVRYVNPALFPNTVINSPASQISIRFNIKGLNVTMAAGICSSIEAVSYAVNFIKLKRSSVILAGGVEELCIQGFLGFYKSGCLSAGLELSCPFDKRRNGILLSEGACVMVLEDYEHALSRGARIYAEIKSAGSAFEPCQMSGYSSVGSGLKSAMQRTIRKAGLSLEDIDYVSASANSSLKGDLLEARAIRDVFAAKISDLPVSALKSMIGECFSASAALQIASAVCAIERQSVPPTINYSQPEEECALNVVCSSFGRKVDNVLVNSLSPGGFNSCAVVSKTN